VTVREGTAARAWPDRLLGLNGWLVFLVLYLPIAVLVLFSFSGSRNVGTWGGFSLEWYDTMLQNDPLLRSLRNSIVVALVSTVVSTVLGTAAGIALERYRRWVTRGAFDGLMYLPVIIPDVTMAVMLLMWFTTISWSLSLTTITLSHIAFNISFVAIVVRARLANTDPSLDEAAADLYATRWRTFRRVTLPVILPGVLGGALLALTLSLDDVVVTSLVQGPGATTLPVFVFGLIKRDVTPEINAVSTLMLAASMVLVLVSLVFQRRAEKE
jgi:spermidine/putrescine transport system permease protein